MFKQRPKLKCFSDRNKLYAAWQALANLADLCGKLTVSVKGEAPQRLDKSKSKMGSTNRCARPT
jgi:hypothetical protein